MTTSRPTCFVNRRGTAVLGTALILVTGLVAGTSHSMLVSARPLIQESSDTAVANAEATIAALQTQVAELTSAEDSSLISSTPSPTAVPLGSDAPLLESDGAELLYYYFGERGNRDSTPIFGEVRNTTDSFLSVPTLNITFFDDKGLIIDTAEVDGVVNIVEPNETMPIEGSTDLFPDAWAREEISLTGGGPASEVALIFYAQDLQVVNVNEVTAEGDQLRVLGQIHNGSAKAANLVSIKALIFDAKGRYIGYEYGQTSDSIPGNSEVAFEFDENINAAPGWTYRIIASGWPEA